ncbi:hypothetical protein K432DRAFT_411523 [Lepidopterella palustris CBS 459.81]|uniref:Uncharacterized protein n=1 Tax=Lepidopterella palustris CBS 459.81 TaxID=1314670 RepID=A0A8E2DW24_9PEZI|nr:hypothetical protein K432DRAFT_411523 [Lepidopterella palustris CBS 459.81]
MEAPCDLNERAQSYQSKRATAQPLFLQLPYRYAIPLLSFSAALHWLVSQSFFLVRIDKVDTQGQLIDWTSAYGFLSLSFLITCIVFFCIIAVITVVALLRFTLQLPFAACCSLVISAACHPPPEESPQCELVQWGHCSISSNPVTLPKKDSVYR